MNDVNERAKLLVVDDDPHNIKILCGLLSNSYQLFTATSGQEALTIAARVRPDLVLLDIRMPDMDGYAVCRAMKDDPLLQQSSIIFVTALAGEEDEGIGLALGAEDYITKPFRPAIVTLRVANHLELKRQRDRLRQLARTDGLSGIPNRRTFDEHLDQEWRRALRSGERLALMMIDIDRFKEFNDTYGHQAGDACLWRVAQTIAASLSRAGDFVARYGGEEFACVLPDGDVAELAAIAEKLRGAVEELWIPHSTSGVAPVVTISVGAATCQPSWETSPELLIAEGDKQLYRSKKEGRNRVHGVNL